MNIQAAEKQSQKELEEMLHELKKLKFPFYSVTIGHNLTDNIYIMLSLDEKQAWINGHIENSEYIKAFIFLNSESWETNNKELLYDFQLCANRTGKRIIQANNRDSQTIIKHVIKQLNKIK